MTQISFTVDLEDPTEEYAPNGRYISLTHRLLEFCVELQLQATFFVVGRVAEAAPDLIKTIAAYGHEIAYHSHAHVSLTDDTPESFRIQTQHDKALLQKLSGQTVIGYRAPRFSLTPQSAWALDILKELGFKYSSSIMPTNISRFGFPNAKHTPFKWPNGLIELPLPVAQLGKLRIPYLGGIYLYALPSFISRWLISRAGKNECLWTYTHTYDFDSKEPYKPMPNTPIWVSMILWASRKVAEKKLQKILTSTTTISVPLAGRARQAIAQLGD